MNFIESSTMELKQTHIKDINKTVVAFANTEGGTLCIGVADDGNIVGVENADEMQLQISNSIRDTIKPDVTMFVQYHTEIIDAKKIVKILVQKGTTNPYYIASKGLRPEGVYVRQGASTVPASESMIRKMIKETDGEQFEDVRSLNQELTFHSARKEFELRNISFGTAQKKTLGIINSDELYTNLALLLSDQCTHTIKVAAFSGTEKIKFRDRQEFEGSLLAQLNEVYKFICRYNANSSEIEGLYRVDKQDYPEDAIREALLNALVHRDYSYSDGTLISIFDDRIEFVSIGGLVTGISFEDVMLGISVARNKKLANVFYRLTLIEAYGMGIPNILRSYSDQVQKPRIEVTGNAFKITLPNRNTENFIQSIQSADTGNRMVTTDNEKAVIKLCEERQHITRKDIEVVLGISQAQAVRILKNLVDAKILKIEGKGKNTKYVSLHGR